MDVFEAIKKRRSVRKFDQRRQVSQNQIQKLLEAARWAPSAGNLQSHFFYVVRERGVKEELVRAALGQEEVGQASVVFVSCADLERSASRYGNRGRDLYAIQDATIATQNMWVAATEMGLGAVWIGAIDEAEVARVLDIPEALRPIALLAVGYPAESPSAPSRRSIEDISEEVK